jgi:NAD(P)-dependent dehydrogenase (short-subunit alcohol dehydrogenase family)
MRTLRVNVGGQFAATNAAISHLRADPPGRVVNISSISGKRPLPYRTPYTASKMAVIGFTRTLAAELGDQDITVNAICPGNVEGERITSVIENQARNQDISYADAEAEFLEDSPMGSFVQPEDVGELVLFLCSRGASQITGQNINVSAGALMY